MQRSPLESRQIILHADAATDLGVNGPQSGSLSLQLVCCWALKAERSDATLSVFVGDKYTPLLGPTWATCLICSSSFMMC